VRLCEESVVQEEIKMEKIKVDDMLTTPHKKTKTCVCSE
jgi:histidinol phosphatase-like enzyme